VFVEDGLQGRSFHQPVKPTIDACRQQFSHRLPGFGGTDLADYPELSNGNGGNRSGPGERSRPQQGAQRCRDPTRESRSVAVRSGRLLDAEPPVEMVLSC